jgi:NAD(P)H-flavin reductase
MPIVQYRGGSYQLQADESVLDGLLRCGIQITHSCKAGICGSCLMRASAGAVPPRAQQGMKDSWKVRGCFYSCVCKPMEDLEIEAADDDVRFAATIVSLSPLSGDVLRVRLSTDRAMVYHSGQYVTVIRDSGLARSYSIASLPEEGELELHVRRVSGGRMSSWFHEEARAGMRLDILGPSGECFYVPGREDQPMLLAGTGTGLAPLYGIVRDALRNGHRGPLHLFHGALHSGGLYLTEELRRLAAEHAHLTFTPSVLKGEPPENVAVGAIDLLIANRIPKLAGWRGYVCGDPGLVESIKRKLFLAGMASRDIYADAFVPAAPGA